MQEPRSTPPTLRSARDVEYSWTARRREWAQRRDAMARAGRPSTPDGMRGRHVPLTDIAAPILRATLALSGLSRRGLENALALRVKTVRFTFAELPAAFDGYRILQLSDLHLDIHPDLADRLRRTVAELETDLVLYTGDYSTRYLDQSRRGLKALAPIARDLSGRDGSYAILGNHDDSRTADALEDMGLDVLINRHVNIVRGNQSLHLTGLDDVHYFYTEDAGNALKSAPEGFRVAAVHSPEAADLAAAAGYQLYLCGHTHGGQICLPGGRPLLSALTRCRDLISGRWRVDDMHGYTSHGVGCSGVPARFNCEPEVSLIELVRPQAPHSA